MSVQTTDSPMPQGMNSALKTYVFLVILAGTLLLGFCARSLQQQLDPSDLLLLLPWLGVLLVGNRFAVRARGSKVASTMNSVLDFYLILQFGGATATWVAALNALWLNGFQLKKPWYRVGFNVGQIALSVSGTALLYSWTHPVLPGVPLEMAHLPGFIVLGLGFFLLNQLLVSTAIYLEQGLPLHRQLSRFHYFDLSANTFAVFLGVTLYYLFQRTGWAGVALMALPLYYLLQHTRRYNKMQELSERLEKQAVALKTQSEELSEKNQRLEELNRNLKDQKLTLQSQTLAVENTNRALSESNRRLRETQEQLLRSEKLKAMGQMANGVAHDFNNILGAILARLELLRLEENLPEPLAKGLAMIQKSASDGAVLVKRIQDFTRGATVRPMDAVDLCDVVDDVIEMTRPLWKQKAGKIGINYDVVCNMESELRVLGNNTELREVLHNLLNNALEAMPNGGAIRISGRQEGEEAVLRVKDTGSGMTSIVAARIFEPYFTTKGVQGNGLGLSVSHGIIKQHGGTIKVDSHPGEGTLFEIRLPLHRQEDKGSLPAGGVAHDLESIRSRHKRRILVVDDEEDVRGVLVEILRAMGHEVDEATGGREGVEKYRRVGYDVLFTDLGMPQISGWDVARSVWRHSAQENSNVVLILVTGWGTQISEQELREHHIHRVLAKPFKINEVKELLETLPERLGPAHSPRQDANAKPFQPPS